MKIAFYDTRPYDKEYFKKNPHFKDHQIDFFEFHLNAKTAQTAQGYDAVCVFVNDKLDVPCLEALQKASVKLIAFRCAGFNNVDLNKAKELGMAIVRVPAYSPYAVAEHTLALLLTLNRKTHRAYNRVRDLNFSLNGFVGFDLAGKTVGIIGTGKIGRITAQIFRGFKTKVLAYDVYPDQAWAQAHQIRYVGLDELFSSSDVVSLHTPLSPETHHLINEKTLARMKKGAYLVNTSRGKLVDTRALIEALKSGHIGGVALDVYEEEEGIFFEDHSWDILQDDTLMRLLTFPNVLITSHQAYFTQEALMEIARVTLENCTRLDKKQALLENTAL